MTRLMTKTAAEALAKAAVGAIHTRTVQPYGKERAVIEATSVRDCLKGRSPLYGEDPNARYTVDVMVKVLEGSETSYLCGHSLTKKTDGRTAFWYGLNGHDLMQGSSLVATCG
jgi:hypothetical protein